jgi:hypothetical protein
VQTRSSPALRWFVLLASAASTPACLLEFPDRSVEEDNAFVFDETDALAGAAPGTGPGEVPPGGPPATPPDPEGSAPPQGPPTKPAPDAPDFPAAPVPDGDAAPSPDPRGCVEGICARCIEGVRTVPRDEGQCPVQDCSPFPRIEEGTDEAGRPYCYIRRTQLLSPCREFAVCAAAGPQTCAPDPDPAAVVGALAPSSCYVIDGCEPGGVPVARPAPGQACPGGTCDENGACVAGPAPEPANCAHLDVPESGHLCPDAEQPADACRFLVFPSMNQNRGQDWDGAGHEGGNPVDWPAIHCGNFCRSIGRECARVIENMAECAWGNVCPWLGRPRNTCELMPEACELAFRDNVLDGLVVDNGMLCDCR